MTEDKHHRYNNPLTATITGIQDLFRKQIPAGELKTSDRLDGKTVLVDGASSGLGFAVAINLARRGAKVIMACRSGIPGQGEKVIKRSGNTDVHMLHVDFSDINSIRDLVLEIKANFAPLDILVCNAGIVPRQSRKTLQGLEEMFMVNYFSKFIFIKLLLENHCFNVDTSRQGDSIFDMPVLSAVRRHSMFNVPRLIFVASESHRNPEKFQWEEFGEYKEYKIGKSIELYGYYKLLLTTFSHELSKRLNPNGKTRFSVFSLCPGPVNSNIAREAPKIFIPLLKLVFGIFFKSPAKAAIPVVYLAASHDLDGKSFDYLFFMSRKTVDEKASDPQNGKRLWELSEQLHKNLQAV
jgi:NAD(P)-dependent dehydrogenase (short-subunit alcohol dehydrogenase family)